MQKLKNWVTAVRKYWVVRELAAYGLIVCRPKERSLQELLDVRSVFREEKGA